MKFNRYKITYLLLLLIVILLFIYYNYLTIEGFVNEKVFPITFSIPEEKITYEISKKSKIISSIIPGKIETYIFSSEKDYYDEYKKSLFATTTKKAGWDCLRHYEILANNCIPYFPDIENCPGNTMGLFDKKMFIESNNLYESVKNKTFDELTREELESCYDLINKWLTFTEKNLTTTKVAQYILNKTNNKNVSKILFLSEDNGVDYLRCLTLHGFKELYKDNCHDYHLVSHLYKSYSKPTEKLYGRGVTCCKLLDDDYRNNDLDATIEDDIKKHFYDIVIYGSYHRGMPLYDLIQSYYNSDEIIILCGEDIHDCKYEEYVNKGHYVFIREL